MSQKLDRKDYWWVKLPIVTAADDYENWGDHFAPLKAEQQKSYNCCTYNNKENFSVSDSPLFSVLGRNEQQLELYPYLLLPLAKIPRQSFISHESGQGDFADPFAMTGLNDAGELKVAHLVPYRPTAQLFKEINKVRIWMQSGVSYFAIVAYYGGFVIPEISKRSGVVPIEDPKTKETKHTKIACMLSQFDVAFSAPFEVFAKTCRLNGLSDEQASRFFKECHGKKVWQSLLLQQRLLPQCTTVAEAAAAQLRETNQLPAAPPDTKQP